MKAVLYGFGTWGKKVYSAFKTNKDIEIVGIIDNKYGIQDREEYEGIPIYEVSEFRQREIIVDCIIISILDSRGAYNAWESVRYINTKIYRIPELMYEFGVALKQDISLLEDFIDVTENNLPYIEMHVQDNCNLNCIACAHYSPLFSENELCLEDFTKDIKQLRTIFSGDIFKIRLMGGEPLLNEELEKYINVAREYFRLSEIHLVTNGLLLTRIKPSLIKTIVDNKIIVDVSDYAPTRKMKDQLLEFAKRNSIHISWIVNTRKEDKFLRTLSQDSIKGKGVSSCENDIGCINIYKGRYAKCPQLMYIPKFNEYFDTCIPDGGRYDLMKPGLTADLFIENIRRTEEICSHCDMEKPEWFDWDNYSVENRPRADDWYKK